MDRPPLDRPARFARTAGLALIALGAGAGVIFVLVPLLAGLFVQSVQLLVAGGVWLATSIAGDASLWDVLVTIGVAVTTGLATPTASIVLGILVLVGVVALYWLQRLLESDEESPR